MDEIAIAGGMTAAELQRIASRLGNAMWCRYWLHWNYPVQEPWLMAISCKAVDGDPIDLEDMGPHGFAREDGEGLIVYTVARTDDDGKPFRGVL
jgi:hypothetical protein